MGFKVIVGAIFVLGLSMSTAANAHDDWGYGGGGYGGGLHQFLHAIGVPHSHGGGDYHPGYGYGGYGGGYGYGGEYGGGAHENLHENGIPHYHYYRDDY